MKIVSVFTISPPKTDKPPTQEMIERMNALADELKAKGAIIETGGHTPGTLELKVSRKNGGTTITDGPFTESKEVVGGFAVLDVKDREEAIALTNRFLDVAGDGTCVLHEVDLF